MTDSSPTARRRAVVTGGGSGIGRAVARRLAADGLQVVVVGRRAGVLDGTARAVDDEVGRQAVSTYVADLTDPDQAEAMGTAIAADGPVHVLVANAGGVAGGDNDSLAATAAAWRADWDLNVLTTVLTAQALLPHLARPGGRVVAMSSVAALRGSGSYGSAKAAVNAWALDLATRLAPEAEYWEGRLTDDDVRARVARIPAGRPGTPDEVAAAVAYMAAEDAGWTTGQILQVNGGTMLGRG